VPRHADPRLIRQDHPVTGSVRRLPGTTSRGRRRHRMSAPPARAWVLPCQLAGGNVCELQPRVSRPAAMPLTACRRGLELLAGRLLASGLTALSLPLSRARAVSCVLGRAERSCLCGTSWPAPDHLGQTSLSRDITVRIAWASSTPTPRPIPSELGITTATLLSPGSLPAIVRAAEIRARSRTAWQAGSFGGRGPAHMQAPQRGRGEAR
jgi:hypothetical protein